MTMRIIKKRLYITINLLVLAFIWLLLPLVNIGGYYFFDSFLTCLLLSIFYFLIYGLTRAHFAYKIKPIDAENNEGYLKQIQVSFKELISLQVKEKRFLKGRSLYEKPWYLVVGAPDSGKSTLSLNTGETYNFKRITPEGIDGKKAPALDWFVSDDAVLLDANARLNSSENDSNPLWFDTLQMIMHTRMLRPLNGIILTISADNLLYANKHEFQRNVNVLKTTLKHCEQAGFHNVPVYLFVTKADKIKGFKDFFSKNAINTYDQAWGVTFPLKISSNYANPIEWFGEAYAKLVDNLNKKLFQAMRRHQDKTENENIFYFPRYVSYMQERLEQLLNDVFYSTDYAYAFNARGVYFSAVTKPEHNFDAKKEDAYFVRDVFQSVVIKESLMGSISERVKNILFLHKKGVYFSVIGLTIVLLASWIFGYTQSSSYLSEIRHSYISTNKYLGYKADNVGYLARLSILEHMAKLKENDYRYSWYYLGFNFPNAINKLTQSVYHEDLVKNFEPYILETIKYNLNRILVNLNSKTYNDIDLFNQRSDLYNWLMIYMMFNKPEHLNKARVLEEFQKYWKDSSVKDAKTQQALSVYLNDLLNLNLTPVVIDQDLTSQVKQEFGGDLSVFRAYNKFKNDLIQKDTDHQLILGGKKEGDVVQNTISIEYAYTYEGWKNYARNALISDLETSKKDQWVFGNQQSSDIEHTQELNKLYSLYWHDYATKWWNAIKSINYRNVDLNEHFDRSVVILNSTSNVIQTTINQIKQNLTPDAISELVKAYPEKKESAVSLTQFVNSNTSVNQLLNAIKSLNNILRVMSQNQGYRQEQAYQLSKLIVNKMQSSYNVLMDIQAHSPSLIKSLVHQYLHSLTKSVFQLSSLYLQNKWTETVYPSCQRDLSSVYPFSDSTTLLGLKTFGQNFSDKGAETNFLNRYAMPFVTQASDGELKAITLNDVTFNFGSKLSNDLNIISELNQLFFYGQDKNQFMPQMTLSLTPVLLSNGLAGISIQYASQQMNYYNGPQFEHKIQWPDTHNDGTVVVTLTLENGEKIIYNYYGTWGLINLLGQLNYEKDNQRYYWLFKGGYRAYFKANSVGLGNISVLSKLKSFSCVGASQV